MTRAAILLLALVLAVPGARAQDVKVAGTDVPAPRRTKFVAPAYPAEAQVRGLRGIVILELVIDEEGKVASADVIRSVPPFDEAALAAARQWEYEVTRVDGRPVRVRVTVPITFALKLPEMEREAGVPEMRQGALPGFPPGLDGPARVVVEVTLLPDGSVAEANVRSGESPWAEGLLHALRTWRFVAPAPGTEVSFAVQADFVSAGKPGQPPRVALRAFEAKVRDLAAKAAETPVAEATPAPTPTATPAPTPAPPAELEREAPVVERPAIPQPASQPAAAAVRPPAPAASPRPVPRATPAPPVEEIITGPAPAPTPPPAQPGFSAVRDVTLALGVPDLVKGRRPVVPPVARMARANGQVLLTLAVDAAGVTTVQKADGPELLKDAARQAAASWSFRRTSAERIYLQAVFTFDGDQARAEVRTAAP
jgi:TonB family protein